MRTVLASLITGLISVVAQVHTYLIIIPIPTAATIGNPYLLIKSAMLPISLSEHRSCHQHEQYDLHLDADLMHY